MAGIEEKYYTILTNIGKAKIANGIGLGKKVDFVKMKVGDGGGVYYNPTESQTDLINTVWEGAIGHVAVDEKNPNWLNIEVLLPPDIGGFMIREYGVFDADNNMLAIAKCAETYKPLPVDGSTKEINMKMVLAVSNTSSINLKIDPTIIFAKKKEIEEVKTKLLDIINPIKEEIEVARGEFKNLTARFDNSDKQLKEMENKISNIKIADGTINEKGIVQLCTSINSTSKTLASTPNATKIAYDKGVEALNKANEAFQFANNGKNIISNVIGGGLNANHKHQDIANHVQWCKDKLNNNLIAKGVTGQNGGWSLSDLVDRVGLIKIMTGAKEVNTGTYSYTKQGVYGNDFVIEIPQNVVGTDWDVCFGSYWGGLSGKFSSFVPGNRLTYSFFTSCLGSMSNVATSSGAWSIRSGYHKIGSTRIDMTININWFTVKF